MLSACSIRLGRGHGRHVFRVEREDVIAPQELDREAGAAPCGFLPGEYAVQLSHEEVIDHGPLEFPGVRQGVDPDLRGLG